VPVVKVVHADTPTIIRLDPEQPQVSIRIEQRTSVAQEVPAPVPKLEPSLSIIPTPRPKSKQAAVRKTTSPFKPAKQASITVAPTQSPRNAVTRQRFSWKSSPPLLWSTILHAIAIAVLMMCSFALTREASVFLTANAVHADESAIPELAEFVMKPIIPDEELTDDLPAEVSEFDNLDVFTEELSTPFTSDSESQFDTPAATDLLATDLGTLMAGMPSEGEGGGSAGGGHGGGAGTDATFFGAKSRGNRFVFVVDNSGSMVDGRMETTLMELQRSVEAMKDDQLFSIIFYSDQVYPMFYPESVMELVPATRENKQKVAKWLPTVEMCLGGRLREAMDLVQELDPQVVYLLSDGDIRSMPLIQHLTEPNDWKFVIHTFGMTVRNPKHMANLSGIASSHGGQFVPVGIHPAAAQMAKQRPIKYNREEGKVWGTQVRPWN
jgi:hypothetical protein